MTSPVPQPPAAAGHPGLLELEGIIHAYPTQERRVLEDVSLRCAPGEVVVVVGPSGCGKSTLLSLAAGMHRPSAGSILLDGKPVTGPGPDRAVVFQEHGLFPWLSAVENVAFGLRMRGLSAAERRERALQALDQVHLVHAADKRIHELSGGMRQRVSIARAMVLEPAVLLMDEPFSALDAHTRTSLHLQVQELCLGSRPTILFVTHSVNEAVRLADRIIVMQAHPGRVRREFKVDLPRPRDFDSNEAAQLAHRVRIEIEQEAARMREFLKGGADAYDI